MASVGIFGGNPNEIAIVILRLCQDKGQNPGIDYYKITENNMIPIVSIDENHMQAPKVWILQETTNYAFLIDKDINEDRYLIVDTDNPVELFPPFPDWSVITYGLNNKASVTASSIADGAMQVCIQRGFKSLGGSAYEPQEFKAACPSFISPLSILGATAACAVCDVLS